MLRGHFPAPKNYYLFKREQPSAMAKASYLANKFDIQTSRVGAFRILIYPEMINLDQNVKVTVNGQTLFDGAVKPDLEFMLRDFIENRDRKLLNIAEIKLKL